MEQPTSNNELIKKLEDRIRQLENQMEILGPAEELIQYIERIGKESFTAKDILSLDEACFLLNASKSQLYKLTRTHRIPHYKPNRKIYFLKSELVEWVKQTPLQ